MKNTFPKKKSCPHLSRLRQLPLFPPPLASSVLLRQPPSPTLSPSLPLISLSPPSTNHKPKHCGLRNMQLTLEFGGGLELLCDSVKIHKVNVEQQKGVEKLTMKDLLTWVRTNLIKERPEMFMKGDTVRPGVLVLVNDCDWELSGLLNTTLEENDVVVFISTLHGG
ncbi:ubiquitin-related modifier 1 homolog 2 [Morus notabilis]|uniref:ubiquitin-related modifier 1 homolog 2 n=1 Tax=Morus notabilis TaxID=981085 RepID=UPI000CED3761|nr:ubiquitin-related modifier 1 homolog 2 [Morus notabilis]